MPVDTSAINTILGAYAQGAQIRQRQEAQKFAEQEAIAQQALRRQQLEEETRRHEATFKQQEARDKAINEFRKKQLDLQTSQHKIASIGAKAAIAEHTQKTGITPPEFTRDLAGVDPESDSIWYKYTSKDDPNFNFVLPSGITRAREVAAQQDIAMQPQRDFEAQKARARLELEAAKQKEAHRSKMLVEEERTRRQEMREDEAYRREVLRSNTRAMLKRGSSKANDDERPLSREDIAEINNANPGANLKFGAKRKDAYGLDIAKKLTASQEKDKEFLDSIEEAALQLQPAVEKNKEYFAGSGFVGGLKELGRKATGKTSTDLASMKAILARLTSVVGNKFFGASFTGGEDERIKAFVPRETKNQNYEDVKANLAELINYTRQTRARLLGRATAPTGKENKWVDVLSK